MSFPFVQPYFGLGNSLQTAQASGAGAAVGGWVELGRTTLGTPGNTITVSSLPNKRYYKCLIDARNGSGTIHDISTRLNGDTGSNYSRRRSSDGGSDTTATSQTEMQVTAQQDEEFAVLYLSNLASKEKLQISHSVSRVGSGAGNAPHRQEAVNKWSNTSDAINSITVHNAAGVHTWATGSECVVLGWDPADTHTTNFWEELASVQGDGTSTTLSSGTIPAKKYLWVQGFTGDAGGANNSALQFNSDTGSNYATRRNLDGGSDSLWTSEAYTQLGTTTNSFFNTFIINNSANEKLAITHWVQRLTAGAGNAPGRGEFVGKWANTSNQITDVTLVQQTTSINWGTDVHLKVWGAS